MRTADDSQPSGDGASSQLGDGFDLSVEDLTGGFGEDLDDDTSSDDTSSDGSDGGFETGSDDERDADEANDSTAADGSASDLSEAEAEEALVDLVEEDGFSPEVAQDIVDDLQEQTGMSAGELLEDITGGSDELGVDAVDGDGLGGPDPLADDPSLTSGLHDSIHGGSSLDVDAGGATGADAADHFDLDLDLGG